MTDDSAPGGLDPGLQPQSPAGFQNTPFLVQIALVQTCLQKAGLNQSRRNPSTNSSTPPSQAG
ncbi:hypothetical protein [Mesorhizobium sp. WSM2239]|uniref:Uncharacterized protein n=2 Tax=unclassified Mesorhizobium TaxID=325217 RepID=A0AAU8DFV5_9HYPH